MLRRVPRPQALLLSAALVASLAACGEGTAPAFESQERLDAVSISGDFGAEPTVEWKSRMSADEAETETLIEGSGADLADGASAIAHLWIGNGFAQEEAFSTYDQDPEVLALDDQLPPYLESLKEASVGDRLAITVSADEAFGEAGNAALGIGNKDSLLVVVDVVSAVADGPEGTERPAPRWTPKLVTEGGNVTGFDFTGVPKPTGKLRTVTLIEGTGPVVRKGQTVVADYLGQVYGGAEPFDESYTGSPAPFEIGVGGVVKAWDMVVVGAKVGSRIVVMVPPRLGYGKKGRPEAGIKGTDTMVFVIDVLAAH